MASELITRKNSEVINYRCSCNYNFTNVCVLVVVVVGPLRHKHEFLFLHVLLDQFSPTVFVCEFYSNDADIY